ncbi:MAG: hypothetical protein LBS90_03855 [Oscillospiraceae bacterium]|jgi:hypothetical protein|nr:hypothetical protein [Oscillospiraceae bacterium]
MDKFNEWLTFALGDAGPGRFIPLTAIAIIIAVLLIGGRRILRVFDIEKGRRKFEQTFGSAVAVQVQQGFEVLNVNGEDAARVSKKSAGFYAALGMNTITVKLADGRVITNGVTVERADSTLEYIAETGLLRVV